MVRRAWSDKETEKPGGRLVTGKVPSFSDGPWTDGSSFKYICNDLRSLSKLIIRSHFSHYMMVDDNSIASVILAPYMINLNAEIQKNELMAVLVLCLFANGMT